MSQEQSIFKKPSYDYRSKRKGIILAGGNGTRLKPLTNILCKQLLPVYDKPMIYYPLSVMLFAGITDILIITTKLDQPHFERLLGDGSQWGIKLSYKIQEKPEGLAQAFIIGEDFIGNDDVCLILGDNIFYGENLRNFLVSADQDTDNATIFACHVHNPHAFGVVEIDTKARPISIEEKPKEPKSNLAVTGLYYYPNDVVKRAQSIKPSPRGELEITDVNKTYMNDKKLNVAAMGRGFAWLDAGTHDSLMEASQFIQAIEKRQGLKISCIEEVAYNMGLIDDKQLLKLVEPVKASEYGKYLYSLIDQT